MVIGEIYTRSARRVFNTFLKVTYPDIHIYLSCITQTEVAAGVGLQASEKNEVQPPVMSLQGVDMPSLSTAVSHFLCCLLVPHFTPSAVGEDMKKKSRRRGRGGGASESAPLGMFTGTELWNLVCQDAIETYNVSDSLG